VAESLAGDINDFSQDFEDDWEKRLKYINLGIKILQTRDEYDINVMLIITCF
jgi:hypothetical protein